MTPRDTLPEAYADCRLCPRLCGVNRLAGELGYCGEDSRIKIAAASIHRGEEPPITGIGGSGTVFVSGCGLGCLFCQNWQASQAGMGRPADTDELAGVFLALQEAGAENINIVTGTHAAPELAGAILAARERGLVIPALWNSSAYESPQALSILEGIIDVWLPDLKTLDSSISAKYFNAPDYPETAQAAIRRMIELSPPRYNEKGSLVSGVIIRHLALPGCLDSSRSVISWFAENAQGRALFSLMTQYTPVNQDKGQPCPDRHISKKEYETLLGWLEEFGVEDGFYQELVQDSGWLPDFNKTNPFSSSLSRPVWHWSSIMPR